MNRNIVSRIDHTSHDHANSKVARAICRKAGLTEAALKMPRVPLKAEDAVEAAIAADTVKVRVYNIDSGDRVEVHAPGCADPRKKDRFADHFDMETDTPRKVWEEYNADFIDEAEALGEPIESAAHTVYVYKCTHLVDRMIEINA